MDVLYARCCGLDVHKQTVVACLLTPGPGGRASEGDPDLRDDDRRPAGAGGLAGGDGLHPRGDGEHRGLLEADLEPAGGAASSCCWSTPGTSRRCPGARPTSRDCEWIADLLRHGLLQASFVPDRPQRELRELTRYRTALVRERTAEVNRLQKTLEGANIKLAAVATDILGKSGRQMLAALVGGRRPTRRRWRSWPRGGCGRSCRSWSGRWPGASGPTSASCSPSSWPTSTSWTTAIARVSAEIAERLRPVDGRPSSGWTRSPGSAADRRGARGRDRDGHDAASRPPATWPPGPGMCPGNHESAGKRSSGKTRKGSPWLRALLVEAAHAGGTDEGHLPGGAVPPAGRAPRARSGRRWRSATPSSSSPTTCCSDGTAYHDLGPRYFDERDRQAVERRLVHRLEGLGYKVSLEPAA